MALFLFSNYTENEWVEVGVENNFGVQKDSGTGGGFVTVAVGSATISTPTSPFDLDYEVEPVLVAFQPTAAGEIRLRFTEEFTDTRDAIFGAWQITNVTAATPTVEQGGSQTVSWTLDVGALTPPTLDYAVVTHTFDGPDYTVASGTPFTVPADAPMGVYDFYVGYVDGGGTIDSDADSICTVLPAKPTDLAGEIISPTQIDITWTNNAIGNDGNSLIQVDVTDEFLDPIEFEKDSNAVSAELDDDIDTTVTNYIRMRSRDSNSDTNSGWTPTLEVAGVAGGGGGDPAEFSSGIGISLGAGSSSGGIGL